MKPKEGDRHQTLVRNGPDAISHDRYDPTANCRLFLSINSNDGFFQKQVMIVIIVDLICRDYHVLSPILVVIRSLDRSFHPLHLLLVIEQEIQVNMASRLTAQTTIKLSSGTEVCSILLRRHLCSS